MKTLNQLYINSTYCNASDDASFEVINPADESKITDVASASVADVTSAVNAASDAFLPWAQKHPRERAEILRRAFDIMSTRLEDFARLITLENGKSKSDSLAEATYAAEFFRWNAEEAVRVKGHMGQTPMSGARALVHHKPAGVAVLVTPWNFPAAMGTRKIAPALAAGCSVVIKPATATPLTMLALMPILEEAGVPAGVVNVLPAHRSSKVVDTMLNDPRVRVISFTGSTAVGRTLLKLAANQIIKPSMELGGNAPFIVFEDSDLDKAVAGLMLAKMRNLGEACTAANRIYLHDKIAEDFTARFVKKMSELKVGNGLEDGVDIGPLVNKATRDKVTYLVEDALAKGAKLELGGKLPEGKGFFYPPTVLTNVPNEAECLHDEIFGPVAAIQTFNNEDEIIKRANSTEYGLVAYVFTSDLKRGLRVSEQLDFGMIGLNRGVVSDPSAPFGGTKQSGLGREGASEGILEFMETQYIATNW